MPIQAKFCPDCGTPRPEAGKFCGTCGHRFIGTQTSTDSVPQPPTTVQEPVQHSPQGSAMSPVTRRVDTSQASASATLGDDRPAAVSPASNPRASVRQPASPKPELPTGWHRVGDGSQRYWNGSEWTHKIVDGHVIDIPAGRSTVEAEPAGPSLAYGPEYVDGADCPNCGFPLDPHGTCTACE